MLLVCLAAPLPAANLDSLLQILPQQTDTTEKLKVLDQIVKAYRFNSPELSLRYARECLELARKAHDQEAEVLALSRIAQNFFDIEDFPQALEHYRRLEQASQAYRNNERLGNAFNGIGNVYLMQNDFAKAREYYERSLSLRRQFGKPGAVAGNLNNIAKILIKQQDFAGAETYLKEALKINQAGGNWRWESYNLLNLGELEIARKQFDQALRYLNQGLALSDSNQFYTGSASFLNLMAEAQSGAGNDYGARETLLQLFSGERAPDREDQVQARKALSQLFEKVGNFREAFTNLKLATALQDSLAAEEEKRKIENIDIAYRIKEGENEDKMKREQEAMESALQLNEARLEKYIYLLCLLVLMAIAGGLFAAYRVHRRNNRNLAHLVEERSRDLELSHSALNTFVYRSSHEIRGTITSIQGLVQLMEDGIAKQEEIMPSLGMKIRQLEKGQRNLILSMELSRSEPNWSSVDLREVTSEVIANIQSQYGRDKIDFRMELPNHTRWTTDAILMRTILDNLLDNSMVFRDKMRVPWCRIAIKIDRESMELRVEDNGSGMSQEIAGQAFEMFFRGSNLSKGSGLGLYIVKMAVERMGGTVRMERKPDPGTVIVITLPKPAVAPAPVP